MNTHQNKQKLQNLLSENPDPSKWSKWLKLIIAILSALLGALAEDKLGVVSNLSNLF